MDNRIKMGIVFIAVILVAFAWMLWIFQNNDIYNKAMLYDQYKPDIEKFQQCYPYHPVIMCPEVKR